MNQITPNDMLQLPAECIGEWLSATLVCGYRGKDFPARLRLLGYLRALGRGRRIIAPLKSGGCMAVDPRDLIQGQVLYSGVYEPEVTQLFEQELRPGDQFIDIGANVGYYSVLAQARGASVIAFEPDPLSAAVWRLNCRLNGAQDRMHLVQVGLGQTNGELPFHRTAVGNTGRSGFRTSDGISCFTVAVQTLDALAADLGLRAGAVWKMDVEGFEGEVLQGARCSLARTPPRLVLFEAEERCTDPTPYQLLEQCGYRIEHLPRQSGEREEKENYIARRRDCLA